MGSASLFSCASFCASSDPPMTVLLSSSMPSNPPNPPVNLFNNLFSTDPQTLVPTEPPPPPASSALNPSPASSSPAFPPSSSFAPLPTTNLLLFNSELPLIARPRDTYLMYTSCGKLDSAPVRVIRVGGTLSGDAAMRDVPDEAFL